MTDAAGDPTVEVVEGPDAGRWVRLDGPLLIGRAQDADLVLRDTQVSRRHVRISPSAGGMVVEDLGSSNGTYVNRTQLHSPVSLQPGDELLVGVTVLELRRPQAAPAPSKPRPVPPALAVAQAEPAYLSPQGTTGEVPARAGAPGGSPPPERSVPELDRLLDARTKARARVAPLAIFAISALAVIVYLGAR